MKKLFITIVFSLFLLSQNFIIKQNEAKSADITLKVVIPDEHKSRVYAAYLVKYEQEIEESIQDYIERVTRIFIKEYVFKVEDEINSYKYEIEISTTLAEIQKQETIIPEDLVE